MSARRCDWCGLFVSKCHPRTVRYAYDIDHGQHVAVYSLATATRRLSQLLCRSCGAAATCCRLHEATREYGTAVGRHLPNGWERCDQTATQADYAEATP